MPRMPKGKFSMFGSGAKRLAIPAFGRTPRRSPGLAAPARKLLLGKKSRKG